MKKKCQVFTPNDYVEKLLDSVGYTINLYGKKILENSCGDGNILLVIVKRYLEDCKRKRFNRKKIIFGLQHDIYGVELDAEQYNKCISRLNELLCIYGIEPLDWNITNEDYLRKEDNRLYDYIVGNPPYVTYNDINKVDRVFLKDNFDSCNKGKFDYCYAFVEKGIKSLAQGGKLAYLIPSSIFKTVFGNKLREIIQPHISQILDFTQEKMFDKALVKSAIMVIDKEYYEGNINYVNSGVGINLVLDKNKLGKKWFFDTGNMRGSQRFGDYFKVSHVVATLLNKAFILKEGDYVETKEYFESNNHLIEKAVVKSTATPRTKRYKKQEKIIFPYYFDNRILKRYTEAEFEKYYPGATAYLKEFREELDNRKSDNNAKWFEYGRSQALSNMNNVKLLISTVVTDTIEGYLLEESCVPYAGMYIIIKNGQTKYSLDKAKEILCSARFYQYVKTVGIHISGSSLRITSKDIEDYLF